MVDAGSAAGWSIAGESHFRTPGTSWGKTTDRSLIIGINGRPIPADAPPYVNGIDFSSTPASNGNYEAVETITAKVSFSEPVTASGSPVLPLTIGTATRNAAYQAMESTATELAFAYTVTAGDRDDDGVSIAADALSGTIRRQGAQTDADLGHGPVADQRPHRVDGIPLVEEPIRVTSSPDAGTWYSSGETIEITVNLTDPVTVSGNPRFQFKLGNGPRNNEGRVIAAAYDAARSTTTSLVFSYTVQTSDVDNNGIWIGDGTQTLLLDAADAVRDAASRDADLNHCVVKPRWRTTRSTAGPGSPAWRSPRVRPRATSTGWAKPSRWPSPTTRKSPWTATRSSSSRSAYRVPPRERVIEGRHTTPAPAAPTAWSSPTSWPPAIWTRTASGSATTPAR